MSTPVQSRPAMVPVAELVRAFFAPVDRNANSGAIFDPAVHGAFLLDAPPEPWLDLGWIGNFRRSSETQIQARSGGKRNSVQGLYRSALAASVEFDFREWGKLQMALAGGSQHMNVLASQSNTKLGPTGADPISAVAVLPNSTATEIVFGSGAADFVQVGDILAVDIDYLQQTGYVGAGISGAYVKDPSDVQRDINFIRRITFNVGRVAGKTATSALLAQPLLGGTPPPMSSAQKVVAFADRDSGSFFQQWSALFVIAGPEGGRVCLYYPRLAPASPAAAPRGSGAGVALETSTEIADPLYSLGLHACFQALPYLDSGDGEEVVCYRSYFPAVSAPLL